MEKLKTKLILGASYLVTLGISLIAPENKVYVVIMAILLFAEASAMTALVIWDCFYGDLVPMLFPLAVFAVSMIWYDRLFPYREADGGEGTVVLIGLFICAVLIVLPAYANDRKKDSPKFVAMNYLDLPFLIVRISLVLCLTVAGTLPICDGFISIRNRETYECVLTEKTAADGESTETDTFTVGYADAVRGGLPEKIEVSRDDGYEVGDRVKLTVGDGFICTYYRTEK